MRLLFVVDLFVSFFVSLLVCFVNMDFASSLLIGRSLAQPVECWFVGDCFLTNVVKSFFSFLFHSILADFGLRPDEFVKNDNYSSLRQNMTIRHLHENLHHDLKDILYRQDFFSIL